MKGTKNQTSPYEAFFWNTLYEKYGALLKMKLNLNIFFIFYLKGDTIVTGQCRYGEYLDMAQTVWDTDYTDTHILVTSCTQLKVEGSVILAMVSKQDRGVLFEYHRAVVPIC